LSNEKNLVQIKLLKDFANGVPGLEDVLGAGVQALVDGVEVYLTELGWRRTFGNERDSIALFPDDFETHGQCDQIGRNFAHFFRGKFRGNYSPKKCGGKWNFPRKKF
jgi:hypothetical protein